MYCVKCGVELQKGIHNCPLCGLRVYHPDIQEAAEAPSYPPYHTSEFRGIRGILVVLSILTLLPMILCFAIDLSVNHQILWSDYAIFGILIAYLILLLPKWFKKNRPMIFFPIDMASILLLVLYICLKTGGGWFLPFVFPVLGAFTLLVEIMIVLITYAAAKKKNRIVVILGSGSIGLGGLCVLMEFLMHLTFRFRMIWWSFIPFTVLFLLGILMICIGCNETLRGSLYKRFFI